MISCSNVSIDTWDFPDFEFGRGLIGGMHVHVRENGDAAGEGTPISQVLPWLREIWHMVQ